MLTIVSRDCALLEREGGPGAAVVDRCRTLAAPGAVDPGSRGRLCPATVDPLRLKVTEGEKQALVAAQSALTQLGIDMHTDALHVTVRAVPLPLRQQNLQILIPELIGYGAAKRIRRRQYRPMDGA